MTLYKLSIVSCILLFIATMASAKIIFFSRRDGGDEIYMMDDDGSNVQRLTNNPRLDTQPRWSPNGKYIAFMRNSSPRLRQYDLFLMDADGSNQQRLTHHPGFDGGYTSWAPDGQHIAFSSHRSGTGNIHVINIASGEVKQFTRYKRNEGIGAQEASWSPNGKEIVYIVVGLDDEAGTAIYIMDADGENQRPFLKGEPGVFRREPRWSPNDEHIMYSEGTFNPQGRLISSRAVIVDRKGNKVRERILPAGWKMSSTSWMGNKKQALLAIESPGHTFDIYLWNFTPNSPLKNLTNHPGVDFTPDWIDDATLDVSLVKKKVTVWGQIKRREGTIVKPTNK
jgi:Tol biopolymer transport system component